MDNEYDLLNQNNEKYLIKITDYKSRLKAIEKELQYEINSVNIFSKTKILKKIFD